MKTTLLFVALCCLLGPAHSAIVDEVPSCYAANKIGLTPALPEREIFVVVDQTTLLDDKLQNSIFENTWGYLGHHSAYTVVSFSAFAQGRYTEVVSSGTIEPLLAEHDRNATSERSLKTFDECMKSQLTWARQRAIEAIRKSLAGASADLAKSDILAALKDVSARVRESPAKDKLLFIASDMLENSSTLSVYASSTGMRTIDPDKEIAAAERANLIGDFGGARVFVIGAGLIRPAANSRSTYRDSQAIDALERFWSRYFEKSNGKLAQFGHPALLQPLPRPGAKQ